MYFMSPNSFINFGLTAFPAWPQCECPDENPDHWTGDDCPAIRDFECTPSGTSTTGFDPPLVDVGPDNADAINEQLDAIGTCCGTPVCESLKCTGEYLDGLISLAIPVLDEHERICFAIAVHAPTARRNVMELRQYLPALRRALGLTDFYALG